MSICNKKCSKQFHRCANQLNSGLVMKQESASSMRTLRQLTLPFQTHADYMLCQLCLSPCWPDFAENNLGLQWPL